jgi:hypothetical protein
MLSQPISSILSHQERRQIIENLGEAIIFGPTGYPFKRSTGEALFWVALDLLTARDKNTAEALRLFAGVLARMEHWDLNELISGPKDIRVLGDMVAFMLEEPTSSSNDDIKKCFNEFRRAIGKRTCHPIALRHQDKLLRAYARDHSYPRHTRANRARRATWVHEHLPAMIARAKDVPCWHTQSDLDDEARVKILSSIDKTTSLSKLSASVLAHLHPISTDYVLKRLLPHRRQ